MGGCITHRRNPLACHSECNSGCHIKGFFLEKTLERITKILMLTTSENDSEALACIRAANSVLKKNNMTWVDIIVGSQPTNSGETRRQESSVSELFQYVYANYYSLSEKRQELVDGFHSFYQSRGRLTEKQKEVLINICESI